MEKPFIILGQGLAGSTLAMRLLDLRKDFLVIDNGRENSSTEVAAGMWNPIVFRKLNKSWKADELLPELEEFYRDIEKKINKKVLHSLKINRVHSSKFESDLWLEKKSLPGYEAYLGNESAIPKGFSQPEHGISTVHQAGYVDLIPFLNGVEEILNKKDVLRIEDIEENSVLDEFSNCTIVDCRGYRCADSHWWSYLPFGKTKGEVLTIRCKQLPLQNIFNAGFFVCPLGEDYFRLGATFNWDEEDDIPTAKGKEQLVNKLKKWIDRPFSVVDHRAGIRPTVADRRPLIGKHSEIENLYLFNGLGTKGVMIAPYLSKVFLDCFLNDKKFPDEVNLERWKQRR